MEGAGASHELLSVEEVASYLGVGPITVYRWCRQGRLPALKVGKVWRIRRGALEDRGAMLELTDHHTAGRRADHAGGRRVRGIGRLGGELSG